MIKLMGIRQRNNVEMKKMRTSNTNRVNLMKPQDVESFLKTAALSYQGYPLFDYLCGEKCNMESVSPILSGSVKASKSDIIGISSGDNGQALALFIKPNYKGTPVLPFLFSGGIKLIFRCSPRIIFRLLNYEKHAMRTKEKYSDENSWYLYSLTVHPEYQHKGLASTVLRPMLDFFDATGQSCYLETNRLCNVSMYEHFGFELMEKDNIPGTNVIHYAMLRKPCGIVKYDT